MVELQVERCIGILPVGMFGVEAQPLVIGKGHSAKLFRQVARRFLIAAGRQFLRLLSHIIEAERQRTAGHQHVQPTCQPRQHARRMGTRLPLKMRNTPPPNYTFVQSSLCFAVVNHPSPAAVPRATGAAALPDCRRFSIQKFSYNSSKRSLCTARESSPSCTSNSRLGHVVEPGVVEPEVVLAQVKRTTRVSPGSSRIFSKRLSSFTGRTLEPTGPADKAARRSRRRALHCSLPLR